MNLYVIFNRDERKYVSLPGSEKSFTASLENAQTFKSYEKAETECCGNENPVSVESRIPIPRDQNTPMNIIKVCKHCGSDDVRVDAWAAWNVHTQEWELAETFDHSHCNNCDGETHIVDKETAL